MKITLINAETDLGITVDGANLGPKMLSNYYINDQRIYNIKTISKPLTIKSTDPHDKNKNLKSVNIFNQQLYTAVANSLDNDEFPIILGGDHSLAIASGLASIKKYEHLGIIWIDSHSDYNTSTTTKTGNIHGLPLATLNNQNGTYLSFYHNGNYYLPENTVIIGGRDIDPWEMPLVERSGVTLFTTQDIHSLGIKNVIKKAFTIAKDGTQGIHLSYDLDIIDPQVAPGISVPAINGITKQEAYQIIEEIMHYKKDIKAIDLVEFNPVKDIAHQTETIALHILEAIIKEMSQ